MATVGAAPARALSPPRGSGGGVAPPLFDTPLRPPPVISADATDAAVAGLIAAVAGLTAAVASLTAGNDALDAASA